MIEYSPADPRKLHPSTFRDVHCDYRRLKDADPWCTPIHQIYNTLEACAPDLSAAIASVQAGTQRLLADMRKYPNEARKLSQALPYIEEFFETCQEISAKLHNQEPARRAAIEALNQSCAKAEQMEKEARQRWLAEVAAGDAYFGGPGSYQRIREEMFAEMDVKKHEALRARIRAFQRSYYEQPAQTVSMAIQVGLWSEETTR